ncbi:right-handed parallel beta-helix repeat-containing protein [Candidatus Dependentiae bacterium]|nr:right-handed parallel beta-helix repeat-containing protein [Candidatus Dependentiae bacterium]
MKNYLLIILSIISIINGTEINSDWLSKELASYELFFHFNENDLKQLSDFIIEKSQENSEIKDSLKELFEESNEVLDDLDQLITRERNSKKILRIVRLIKKELENCCSNLSGQNANITNIINNCCENLTNLITNLTFATSTVDLSSVFTALVDIKNTITECCAELLSTITSVFPCAATPITQAEIPYTITSPGLYCLADPVTNPSASPAITISSDNVTLDLNGNVINMQGSSGSGVSIGAVTNITVKNGNIVNSTGNGISATGSSQLFIDQVKTSTLANGINLSNVTNSIVNELIAKNCTISGITATNNSNTITLKNSSINNCVSGIQLAAVTNFSVENNVITNNTSNGIVVNQSTLGKITNNLISNYSNIGIGFVSTSLRNTVMNNFLETSVGATIGISIAASATNNNIRSNTVLAAGGGSTGILNSGGTTNIICLNYAEGNTTNYSGVPASLILTPGTPGAIYSTDDQFANASNA